MKRTVILLVGLATILSLLAAVAFAEGDEAAEKKEEVKHEYIGAKKCKICHKDEYTSWLETAHAKAWESLKPEEQANPECAGCHSTGVSSKDELLTGVQCEVCHGPGSDYKKKSVMEDREKAMAAGLIIPDSTLCVSCHNEKSPTFKGFDFQKYISDPKGIHVMPTSEEAKPEAKEAEKEG